jgi:OmcA/MtrC family decaheme c-type cytochrome
MPPTPPPVTINARALTEEQWAALRLKGEITSVTMGTTPVVGFRLTDGFDTPISGMSWTSKAAANAYAAYPNLAFGVAKLIPERYDSDNERMVAPSRWVNYIVTSNPTAAAPTVWNPTRPTTDNIGDLIDNGDGSYKYTFRRDLTQVKAQLDAFANYNAANIKADLDDVTYDPNLTHRVTVQVSGAYRGTGRTSSRDANTPDGSDSGRAAINMVGPLNLVYDFIPAAGRPVTEADTQRELVSTAACNDCHSVIGHGFHNGGRTDARYCAMCHTDQRKYGYADNTNNKQKNHAVGDFVMLGHTLHLGNRGFKASLSPRTAHNYNYAGVAYKETGYPMDIKYCTQCHNSDRAGAPAARGDNWKTKPSRLACGACHDGIDWTQSHHGPVRSDDSSCGTCHGAEATRSPFNSHRPHDATKLNPTTSDRYHNFTYDLRSATLNAERHPVVEFRIKLDGEAITNVAQLRNPPPGFTGGPSFYVAGALPQDGVEKPADFNFYTAVALNAAANVFSAAPDADGYWTVTLEGYTLPANASMVMCYMARGYTQSDIVAADDPLYSRYRVTATKKVLMGGIPGNVARREVTSAAKCNDCHELLGTSYITRQYGAHGASVANDPSLCGLCHSVTGASRGWSRNIQYITHAVHGIGKRTVQYSSYIGVTRPPNNLKGIGAYGYPGVLNDCEQCHLPGTYDFSNAASLDALPSMVWSTVATGTHAAGATTSPYVVLGTNYGSGFSNGTQATTASLVNSPISHACFGCHDSASAIAHMKQNGGALYENRGSLNGNVQGAALTGKVETCLVCHGPGRSADIKKAHSKF